MREQAIERTPSQSCLGGCLLLAIFAVIPLGYFQISPYFAAKALIQVVVLDSRGVPQPGIAINYREGTIAPLIPLIPFGPGRSLQNIASVTTNAQGKATFSIRWDTYVESLQRDGSKLVVHHSSNAIEGYPPHVFDTINGAGIMQWFPYTKPPRSQKTEIHLASEAEATRTKKR